MPFDLPTGKHPQWELDGEDGDSEPKGLLESCVLFQSLRQSREQWMYSIFPRFSGRIRGKPGPNPPPHTIQSRGRCEIEIGPHIFSETSFWEVQYLPQASASSWQSSYTHSYTQSPAAPVPQQTAPLLSSLSSATSITPALINKVNAAAAANPTLANLLQLAAAGQGSPEQLQTLGLLIQSLAISDIPEAPPSAQSYSPTAVVKKEWDLVLSYHETSYDRWILPRCPVICEKVADSKSPDLVYDIELTLALNPPQSPTEGQGDTPPQVVIIRVKRPPPAVWELIWRWVGGEEKINENRVILEDLKKKNNRVYLAHRLPQSSLLTQLQNAAGPQYAMKHIKPSPVVQPRAKRAPPQRKPAAAATTLQPLGSSPTASSSTAPSAPAPTSQTTPEAKRRKMTKPAPPTTKIRCHTCQKTDVPLVYGGRYCRECVQAGKVETIYVPYKPPQYPSQPSGAPAYTPSPLASSSTSASTSQPS